jgi:ABC-type sulfate transport system substrate-binding protein
VLLAYAYQHKAQGLNLGDINDSAFQRWMKEIEEGVTDTPDSTDTLFNAFLLKGPSAYNVVVVYENQAVRGITQARQSLRVIYPPATTWSDHPFAVLEAPWNTPEQQEAARMFRDFLLGEPAQRLALRYGFRPANAAVALNANLPDNPFPAATSAGVQQTAPGSVAPPAPELIDALVSLWQQTRR